FEHILNLSSGRQFEELNGLSTPKFNSLPGMFLLNGLSSLEKLAILIALLALGAYLVRKARVTERFPFFEMSNEPVLVLFFLWMIVPWVFFAVTGMKSYVIYFSFMFPVPFFLVAWLFARLQDFGDKRGGYLSRICVVTLVAVVCSQALYVERLYRFWDQEGGALGTRGEDYKYQVAVSEAIVERAQSKSPIVTSDW